MIITAKTTFLSVVTGQGTMGLEVLDQVPDMDAIVVPVGGGGLIAGDVR
jgi:threonine dehydratase